MKTVLRWFPDGDDSVSLKQIRQIPGVSGVATCLPSVPVGEEWPLERLRALRAEINDNNLECEVIESVNIHEDIKKGLPSRDRYIEAYIKTIRNLSLIGVKCLCYNFMPVIDWVRSDLASPMPDGSSVMEYIHEKVVNVTPSELAAAMSGKARGYSLPGWEPERISRMRADIEFYGSLSTEDYWANLKYFLDAVIPEAEKADIKMAIHPDDPPWQLFGLPKVITNAENIRRFLSLNTSKYNGLTLCTGSLGADPENDLPAMIREFCEAGRIHFAHVRNIRRLSARDFVECAHMDGCGDLDMFEIMRALSDTKFDGYMRPDHGRMIWGEKARPGYGLYDRALGVQYLLGLNEAIERRSK